MGEKFAERFIGGQTLAAMVESDLTEPEPHGLGLSPADVAAVMQLIKRIKALPPKQQ